MIAVHFTSIREIGVLSFLLGRASLSDHLPLRYLLCHLANLLAYIKTRVLIFLISRKLCAQAQVADGMLFQKLSGAFNVV